MIRTNCIVESILDVPTSWVFEHYCKLNEKLVGQDVSILSLFNPKDRRPSMSIFNSGGLYFFKDFSTGLGGDNITLVERLYNLSRSQAVNKIIIDYGEYLSLNGNKGSSSILPERVPYELESYELRAWTNYDANYWLPYGITSQQLDHYCIKPLESYTFSKEENGIYTCFKSEKPYTYGFFRKDGSIYKIYQPYNRDRKFMKIKSYIQGYDQLTFKKKYLGILSSLKDGMCLMNFNYNIEFIAPESEGNIINPSKISMLQSKYEMLFCLLDNDPSGIAAMEKYKTLYNLPLILLPLEKDLAKSVKRHGYDKVNETLRPLLVKELKR